MPSCGVRMSVRLSRSWILSKRILKHIFKIFLPSGNHTILIFPYQALWQYYDGDPLTGAKIAIFYQYFALRWLLERQARLSRSAAAFLYHADGRRCQHQWILFHQAWTLFLSVDGYMPETTEQNLIVRIGESEAEVTNNIRLRSRYCTVEANYRQTRSIARPVCGSKATLVSCTYHAHQFIFSFTLYFLFILCGRLSCLYSAILPHVKYTLSYHIVSYCIVLYCIKQLMAFVWWRLFGRRLSGGGGKYSDTTHQCGCLFVVGSSTSAFYVRRIISSPERRTRGHLPPPYISHLRVSVSPRPLSIERLPPTFDVQFPFANEASRRWHRSTRFFLRLCRAAQRDPDQMHCTATDHQVSSQRLQHNAPNQQLTTTAFFLSDHDQAVSRLASKRLFNHISTAHAQKPPLSTFDLNLTSPLYYYEIPTARL